MKKLYQKVIFIKQILGVVTLMVLAFTDLRAQSGACAIGSYINYLSMVNFTGSTAGDMTLTVDGSLQIGPAGVYDVYGAINNAGNIVVDNGGVLNIYGDVFNSGSLTVNSGGRVNFYGTNWQDSSIASVDGTGDIYFTSSRPSIPASWLATAPCISSYSAGSFAQNLDGGGKSVDMDIRLFVNNANNIVLTGSTSIAGSLNFNVNNGDVLLGNNDLILTAPAVINSYNPTRIVVTNGTGHLVKEGLASSASFFYPIGRSEGDYTPATITNNAGSSDTFRTQVKNYFESASDEFDPTSGMDRTWNIYSDNGSAATIKLQHNSSTNHSGDYTTQGGDPAAFVTQYQGQQWITSTQQIQGVWELGTGGTGTYAAGTIGGSSTHFRNYSATATSATADGAYFSKSSNTFAPLPVALLSFEVSKAGRLKADVSWVTTHEKNCMGFEVTRLNTANNQWETIGWVPSSKSTNTTCRYTYLDENAQEGVNYYRLKSIDYNNESSLSEIRSLSFSQDINSSIVIFPNPGGASSELHVDCDEVIEQFMIIDAQGKIVFNQKFDVNHIDLDVSDLSNGSYTIVVNGKSFSWVK